MGNVSPTGVTSDRVVEAIKTFVEDRGWPPTVRELAAELGLGSTSTQYWLNKLVEEGRIVRGDSPRAIRVVD